MRIKVLLRKSDSNRFGNKQFPTLCLRVVNTMFTFMEILGGYIMTTNSIDAAEAAIDGALSDAFGKRKGTLLDKMNKAGRRLPREVADDVAQLEELRRRTAHPRRRGQIDAKQVNAIRDHSIKALGKVDVERDKARARINWLGVLVINLMMFGVAYYALIKWLGLI
jgi:hypothetical protein